jgi:hypothetical protein
MGGRQEGGGVRVNGMNDLDGRVLTNFVTIKSGNIVMFWTQNIFFLKKI